MTCPNINSVVLKKEVDFTDSETASLILKTAHACLLTLLHDVLLDSLPLDKLRILHYLVWGVEDEHCGEG